MLYEIGDIVQIKSKEWWDQQPKDSDEDAYDDWSQCFSREMVRYCGEITKIKDIILGFYVLEIDNHYYWIDEFLEDGVIL